jgi:hypothetical protein
VEKKEIRKKSGELQAFLERGGGRLRDTKGVMSFFDSNETIWYTGKYVKTIANRISWSLVSCHEPRQTRRRYLC